MRRITSKYIKSLTAVLFVVAIQFVTSVAQAQQAMPTDVARFIERRDLCDHFRGEEPYDAERGAFLKFQIDKYCKGSDRQLATLKRKYERQKDVLSKLNEYEVKIEGP
jgi:hypothetical protein